MMRSPNAKMKIWSRSSLGRRSKKAPFGNWVMCSCDGRGVRTCFRIGGKPGRPGGNAASGASWSSLRIPRSHFRNLAIFRSVLLDGRGSLGAYRSAHNAYTMRLHAHISERILGSASLTQSPIFSRAESTDSRSHSFLKNSTYQRFLSGCSIDVSSRVIDSYHSSTKLDGAFSETSPCPQVT